MHRARDSSPLYDDSAIQLSHMLDASLSREVDGAADERQPHS